MHSTERRIPTKLQFVKDLVLTVMAVLVAPLLGWLLLQAVQVQKDVVAMRLQISYVQADITQHRLDSQKDSDSVGRLHHRQDITPCNRCHNS